MLKHNLRIVHLDSVDALRAAAAAWDDLWQRSDATLPSLRADLLAQWVEHFARPGDFHAVAVESEGRCVAALPLVRRKIGRLFKAGTMPCNEWSASGDLLLDASWQERETDSVGQKRVTASMDRWGRHSCLPPADRNVCPTAELQSLADALAAAMHEVPWPLLWLDEAVLDAPRWQQLQRAAICTGMTVAEHPRWHVGRVEIDHDWPAYTARWSRKHRQKMAASARRLAQRGDVRLVVHSRLAPGEVAPVMRQCFEIEDRGWKGAAGTSVLSTPGMAEFFTVQAELAARSGHLELAVLHCGGRPVAFSCGLSAKGVFHSVKTGYDPEFARQSPGQLLRYYLLKQFFADPERKAMDFQGPMTEAHAAWLPERYSVGRVAIAPRGAWGRLAVRAYRNLWLAPLVLRHRDKRPSL